ncbi:MAG TPA: hypothetical protein PKK68_09005, partial [Methanothrix soehngenii]|nr:hypothetical protein [Methanothrix soehngenii]
MIAVMQSFLLWVDDKHNSIDMKPRSMVLAVLCMLLLPIGESQPSFDASEDLNSSLELVFPEAPVELFDTNINS